MRYSNILVGSSIGLFAILFSTVVFAQSEDVSMATIIRLEAGKMLEIGSDTYSAKPDFSWILSKDRKFQNAQRSRFFQTRFAQTGVYSLDISVQDTDSSQNEYHAFQIVITDPVTAPQPATDTAAGLKAVLQTLPETINGTVYLPPDGGLLTMDSSASISKISRYALDFDSGVDADADGDPQNDFENLGTFAAKTGSPLLYFMTQKGRERNITLTVTDAITGKTDTSSVNVIFGTAPAETGHRQTSDETSPITIEQTASTVHFGTRLPDAQILGKQLLYEWNFGDGSRSLLNQPEHTYASAGGYAVSLTVRDITSGQIVYQGSNGVQIETSTIPSSGSSSSQNTAPDKPDESSESGSGLGSILIVGLIVIVLLSLAIGMYAFFMWIKRKTTGKLVETIENMEKTIVKSEKGSDSKPEPFKIKKETASGPVPSWLQKASTSSPVSTVASPPSPPPAMTVSAVPTPAPVPDWLKQAPKKVETPQVTKPSAPTQQPAPTSAPKPTSPAATVENPKPSAPPATIETPKPKIEQKSCAPTPPPAPKTPTAETKTTSKPIPAPKPAISEMKTVPKAASVPEKKPAPMQDIPKASPTPKQEIKKVSPKKDDDQPIAIIKADSLMKE